MSAWSGGGANGYTVDVSAYAPVLLPARVGFSAVGSRRFALHDPDSGRPQLTGTVTDQ
jgi:hypothetical protein